MAKETRTMHIPLDLHTKLKIEASKKGVLLRELVIEILEKATKEDK